MKKRRFDEETAIHVGRGNISTIFLYIKDHFGYKDGIYFIGLTIVDNATGFC